MTDTPDPWKPPPHVVAQAVESSTCSPCRSKRGVAIFGSYGGVISTGCNYKPSAFACDGSEACKATCNAEAIHAEQQALLAAGRRADGADLLHVKTVDGALVPSGGPSCVQCSKLALVAGIQGVWLFHESGWKRYDVEEFHRLSLAARASSDAQTRQRVEDAFQAGFNRGRQEKCDGRH